MHNMETLGCFVRNENTLGYMYRVDGGPLMFGVLVGSVLKGGLNPLNGSVFVSDADTYRKATKEDFKDYRVDSTNYNVE